MYKYSLPIAANTEQMRRPYYTPAVTASKSAETLWLKTWQENQTHWTRLLRRRSAAARLLEMGVRIPPGHGCLSVVSGVNCQVEVSAASVWSLVQSRPAEYGVSECDREASIMKRPWPTRGCCAIKMRIKYRRYYKLTIFPIIKTIIFFSNIK